MRYVIASNAAFDKIHFTDGRISDYKAGGAGIHALTGVKLWTDEVALVCGVGRDYQEQMGGWLSDNQICTEGFYIRDQHNPMNIIYYQEDGERSDETIYGDAHYNSLDCTAEDLECYLESHPETEAVYTFKGDDERFWSQVLSLKEKYRFKMMWEINASICVPKKLDRITEILKHVEAFSLNRREAAQLFSVETEEEAIKKLKELNLSMVLYRVGAKGLYVITDQETGFYESINKGEVVDVTGCGNASSSASFYAWAEGKSCREIGIMANIASYLCLKEYSAMCVDQEQQKKTKNLYEKLRMDNPMRRNVFDLPNLCVNQCAAIEAESRMILTTPEIFRITKIILTGCGDSFAAGIAAKYAFEDLAGIPVQLVRSMDLSRHVSEEILKSHKGTILVIAVSNSGGVSRVAEAMERCKKYGCLTLAVTGRAESALAKAAERMVKLSIPPFEAANGVRSYLVSLLSLLLIAIRMGEAKCRYPMAKAEEYRMNICEYAKSMEEALEDIDDTMYEIAVKSVDMKMFDFVGSGCEYGTAWFSHAKIIEATGDYASFTNVEDWFHLNCFLKYIDEIFTMVITHKDSRAVSRTQELIEAMADMKRNLYLITDSDEYIIPEGVTQIQMPCCEERWMAPLFTQIPVSLLAGYLCELKHEAYGRGCRDNWSVCGTTDLLTKSKVEIY